MPRQRRTAANPNQLGLILQGEGFEGALETRGLFSLAYLSRHLTIAPEFASAAECGAIHREIGEIWHRHLRALSSRRRNEAFTCSTLLEPILDRLGWRLIPQETMPNLTTRKKPDYCLFTSETDYFAAAEADASVLFRLSATVLEAKRYKHSLDQISTRETPGWFPSQQVQDYLDHAKDASGRRFFNWAILTNGSVWRLYADRSAVGAYFAFHLVKGNQFCSLEEFRTFVTLFRASAFERDQAGSCLLDSIREHSLSRDAVRRTVFFDMKTDFVAGLLRGRHQLMDGLEDRLNLLVVTGNSPLQSRELLGQFPVRGRHFPQAHKSAHDLDIHLDCTRAVQHA